MLYRVFILTSLAIGLVSGLVGSTGCGGCDGGGFPSDAFMPDAEATGTVSVTFSLTDQQSAPIPCTQVGANTVFLQLKSRTAASGVAVSLTCGSGGGVSQQIPVGTYDVSFDLNGFNAINGAPVTLASAPPVNGVVVKAGLDTAMPPVVFAVDATGGLALSLVVPLASSNCKQNGAAITTNTITLIHNGDGCAPVTFTRSRGSTTPSSYTVSCSSPTIATCIENDELLTVSNIASGGYTIHVRGRVNSLDCWTNDDMLQVPPKGQTLTVTLNLAFLSTPGCVLPQ